MDSFEAGSTLESILANEPTVESAAREASSKGVGTRQIYNLYITVNWISQHNEAALTVSWYDEMGKATSRKWFTAVDALQLIRNAFGAARTLAEELQDED